MQKIRKRVKIIKPSYIFIIVICTIIISGCSPKSNLEFRYSFLNSNELNNFAESLLSESGIPNKNVRRWLEFVGKYNAKQAEFVSSTNSGWVNTSIRNYSKINFNETLNGWSKEEVENLDINCRIALFSLIADSLQFNGEISGEVYESEINKMNNLLGFNLSSNQVSVFKALFIPLGAAGDIDLKIPNQFKVLRIYLDSNNDNISEMAHTALIIEKDENLYLIEKKNPGYPFQISEFNNLKEIFIYYNHIYKQDKEIYVNLQKAIVS